MNQRTAVFVGIVCCLVTSALAAMGVGVREEGDLSPLSFDGSRRKEFGQLFCRKLPY